MFRREDQEHARAQRELADRQAELERNRKAPPGLSRHLPPPRVPRHTGGLEEPMPLFRPPSKPAKGKP